MQTYLKSHVLEAVANMPERFTIIELQKTLSLWEDLQPALEQSKQGDVISQEEVFATMEKWIQDRKLQNDNG